MSTSSITAAITTAASVASGRFSNRPVRNSSVTTVERRDGQPGHLRLRPGAAVHRGLGQAAVDHHAGGEPGAEVGGTHPDQLPVGVDLVAGRRGVRLRRAQPLGEADQQDTRPPAPTSRGSRAGRPPAAGRPGGARTSIGPTIATPLAVEMEHADRGDPEQHRHQGSRHQRQPPAQPEHDDQARDAHRERAPVGVAELAEQVPDLLKKSPPPLGTPNSLGSCPAMIVRASPTMKPLSTGSEMNDARKPSRAQPGHQPEHAGHDRQRRGQRQVAVGPGLGVHRDDARRQGGRGGHGRDDEVPRRPERRVQHERGHRRVQADDRWHPGDRRVRQRLGDQHRPDGQARQQVRPQPLPPVVGQPAEGHAGQARTTGGITYVPASTGSAGWYIRRIGRNGPAGVGSQFAAQSRSPGSSCCNVIVSEPSSPRTEAGRAVADRVAADRVRDEVEVGRCRTSSPTRTPPTGGARGEAAARSGCVPSSVVPSPSHVDHRVGGLVAVVAPQPAARGDRRGSA